MYVCVCVRLMAVALGKGWMEGMEGVDVFGGYWVGAVSGVSCFRRFSFHSLMV